MANKKSISEHFNGERFFNPTHPQDAGNFFSGLKMFATSKRESWPNNVENKGTPKLDHVLTNDQTAITFVNHATFLIQLPGLNILTDPVWSKRVSPFSWLGPARVRKPGIDFDKLPKIDLILLSHNHYDHLDKDTLIQLNKRFSPMIFVAAGDKELVESLGFKDVREFDWWEKANLSGDVEITFAPTQHFSARTLFDKNRSLWGSYMIKNKYGSIYFGGDAGYSEHYKSIQQRLGSPDVSLIGIGAYEPNWFMKPMHMNPTEAVQAHQDLKSKLSIGMHFGTFQLSTEGIDHPIRDLRIALERADVSKESFITVEEGETHVYRLNSDYKKVASQDF